MKSVAGEVTTAVLASCLVSSCWFEVPPEWQDGSPGEAEPNAEYFAAGDLGDRGDAFLREWYSKHLSAAQEPALRELSSKEVYRFIHLPSFRHPVIIRVDSRSNDPIIIVKQLGGAGGYDPGEIVTKRHRRLTSAEWEEIENAVAGMRFWALPKHQCESRDHPDDGMVWVLEGKMDQDYAVVQWHWDDCSACRHLISLAEVQLQSVVPSKIAPPTLPVVPPPPDLRW